MNLVETGIEGFDVAFGGLRRGQVILVVGNAGSGKTTFCAKVLYEGAKRFEEPGLFLSTVESKKEFYDYMRLLGMDFKELEEKGLFRFVEMLTPTSKGDLMNLSRELTKNALDMGARRIALDTITPFLMISPSIEARAILHNAVKTISRELDSILILTGEVPLGVSEVGHGVEEFVVDGLIRLRLEVDEVGAPKRLMEVLKLRGCPLGRSWYEFEIGPPFGLKVYLSGVIEKLESRIDLRDRLSTGVDGLDELLGGGLIRGTSTTISGPPGSGKTLVALSIAAENALKGEKVAFISFEEPEQQILATLEFLGYDPNVLRERAKILSVNPRAITLRSAYDIIHRFCGIGGGEVTLLVVDGLTSLKRTFGKEFHRIIRDLVYRAKRSGITTVFSVLGNAPEREFETYLSTLADNLVELRIREGEGRLRRELLIRKARMSEISEGVCELRLEKGRLSVRCELS